MIILLTVMFSINLLLGISAFSMAFFNRRHLLESSKNSRGIVNLSNTKKKEKDVIDEMNKKYSRMVKQEFDFIDMTGDY